MNSRVFDMLGRLLNLKWYTQKEYRMVDYAILLTMAFITSELCNQRLDHMGVVDTGQFPIKSLMLYGEELVINAE